MRILHVVTLVDPLGAYGGPATVALHQAEELATENHSLTILAGWVSDEQPPQSHGVVQLALPRVRPFIPGAPGFTGLYSREMARVTRAAVEDADVIHVHLSRDLIPLRAAVLSLRFDKPLFVQPHGMLRPDRRAWARVVDAVATKKALRGASAIFSLDEHEDALLGELGQFTHPVRLSNGIPLAEHRHPRKPRPEVLFLARLHPIKRVTIFAEAADLIASRNPNVSFTVIGPDQGDLKELQRMQASLANGDRIRYEGPIQPVDVAERMSRAQIYVLPSVDERFPMTVVQALAEGVPTVVTSGCGMADSLRSNDAAVVVGPSAGEIAEAIDHLLANSELRQRIGASGRRYAEQHFSIKAVARQLEREYETALSK